MREWIDIPRKEEDELDTKRVLRFQTWNMLAQTLVRRELFPNSDCLKAAHRDPMTLDELTMYNADVLCLQEVDRLDKLLPPLRDAGYQDTYGAGPGKLHGCMILHREQLLEKVGERVVQYDQLAVGPLHDGQPRLGIGRITRNIGLMVALRDKHAPGRGCIVATTHLFWHPSYTYERARQAALLAREVRQFRAELHFQDWPCFILGDFNFPPTDAGYALLVGSPWSAQQQQSLEKSRVVHVSLDPSIESGAAPADDDDEGGGEKGTDPDRIIVNCRVAAPSDGILTLDELRALGPATALWSIYDRALRTGADVSGLELYRSRLPPEMHTALGAFEPKFTSYTHYWKATLDYMFVLGAETEGTASPEVLRILRPHIATAMEPGLPRLHVCASDHVSLAADVLLPRAD
ncbi:Endonuclease/exonuclease/phosphatase [Auricularia subglabra TFB-10046 SS5]|nr:Endonuclease/exonuclease/phosphatase [Auricularia subglabra TFB-10046 SS5]